MSLVVKSPLALGLLLIVAANAAAQYSQVATPFHNVGDRQFERIGLGFGGNIGNNVFFNNGGGANNVLPPFGGGAGGGGAGFGFGVKGSNFGFNLGGVADSGYSSGITSVTPSVTVGNGGTGTIFSGSQRPFVTGLVPVVGHFAPGVGFTHMRPVYGSPLVERLARMQESSQSAAPTTPAREPSEPAPPTRVRSTAERGDLSLSAIRAQAAAEAAAEDEEIAAYIEAARLREAAGEIGQAIIDYGRAASNAKGQQKRDLLRKIESLRAQRKQK